MTEMGFLPHITELIRSLYKDQEATVRTENGDCDWFAIGQGVRHSHSTCSTYTLSSS